MLEAHEYLRSIQKTVLRVPNLPQAMSLVCMWVLFVVLNASLVCVLVRILSNAHLGPLWDATRKRSVTHGNEQPLCGDKEKPVTFLPALANNSGPWTILNYVGIVSMCEIKYRYYGLWWMDGVSQISVMSTLKTFPKWPYKEFLKRCLLRIKRSNWWKKKVSWILTLHNSFIFFFYFQHFGVEKWDISKHTLQNTDITS